MAVVGTPLAQRSAARVTVADMPTGGRWGATERWPIAIALGVTLLLASLLLAAHVPETDIDLEVSASEVSFTLSAQQAIMDATRVAALGVAGARRIQLPRGAGGEELPGADDDAAPAVELSLPDDGAAGTITLSALVLPAGTRVSLRVAPADRYRMSVTPPDGGELQVAASVLGSVDVGFSNASPAVLSAKTPKGVTILGGPGTVDLDLALLPGEPRRLADNLGIENLALARLEEVHDGARTAIRRIPTIRSGTLYLNALDGKAVELNKRQALEFEASEGELRSVAFSEAGVELSFTGRVRGMTGGSTRHRVDLMPSILEWLAANRTLTLLWSTALSLFGTWFTVVRWWRNRMGDDYS